MKTRLFFAAASAMMLAACSNNDNYVAYEGPVEAQFTAGIGSAQTRAEGDSYDTWTEGQAIGVIVTKVANDDGDLDLSNTKMGGYKNVKYTATNLTNEGKSADFEADGTKIYFNDGTYKVDFAAYSPYCSTEDADLTALPVETTSSDVDYIFASAFKKTYKDNKVALEFKHVMSKLTINITKSDEITADISEVKLDKLIQKGTFNAKTGVLTTTDAASVLSYKSDFSEQSFYLVPQTTDGNVKLSIIIGEETYSTEISPALAEGMEYTYNITAKKYGLELTGCTIKAYGKADAVSKEALL
jgi:hypothetical protein